MRCCLRHSISQSLTARYMQGALRILKPGQRANIWLELRMPEVNGDVFQVIHPAIPDLNAVPLHSYMLAAVWHVAGLRQKA